MTILNGHFDGQRIVLDDPIPKDIPVDTPVRIYFEAKIGGVFAELAQLAGPDDLPADYAEQHEHYVKGTPRK